MNAEADGSTKLALVLGGTTALTGSRLELAPAMPAPRVGSPKTVPDEISAVVTV